MGRAKVSRFVAGWTTYRCGRCGKLTRDTGIGERGVGLCARCYEQLEIDNAVDPFHTHGKFLFGDDCYVCRALAEADQTAENKS